MIGHDDGDVLIRDKTHQLQIVVVMESGGAYEFLSHPSQPRQERIEFLLERISESALSTLRQETWPEKVVVGGGWRDVPVAFRIIRLISPASFQLLEREVGSGVRVEAYLFHCSRILRRHSQTRSVPDHPRS